jgi:hypothetical protein
MVKKIPSDGERIPRRDRVRSKKKSRRRVDSDEWEDPRLGRSTRRSRPPKRAKRLFPADLGLEDIFEDPDAILDDFLDEEDFES